MRFAEREEFFVKEQACTLGQRGTFGLDLHPSPLVRCADSVCSLFACHALEIFCPKMRTCRAVVLVNDRLTGCRPARKK